MNEGIIFSKVTAEPARQSILQNLNTIRCLIPTLNTFFQNLKYLEPCCATLRCLLPPKMNKTVFQAYRNAYVGPAAHAVDTAQGLRSCEAVADENAQRDRNYHQLWLFAMRHFTELTPHFTRKDPDAKSRLSKPNRGAHPIVLQRFARLATLLGFRTCQTRQILAKDTCRTLAAEFLEDAGVDKPTPVSIDGVASVLRRARRARDAAEDAPPDDNALVEAVAPAVSRYGRPFQHDHFQDRCLLYLDALHDMKVTHETRVTTVVVKRDILQAFLGVLDIQVRLPSASLRDD